MNEIIKDYDYLYTQLTIDYPNFTGKLIIKDNFSPNKYGSMSPGIHYFKNGKRHREDGPACEFASGGKQWIQNGDFHREDGPAVIHSDGDDDGNWWLNGVKYTKEEWITEMRNRRLEKFLEDE